MRTALVLVVLTLIGSPAFAQTAPPATTSPAEDDPWRRQLALEIDLGLGTPIGYIGPQVELAPIRFVGVRAGIGVGSQGPNGSGMLFVRFPASKSFAVSLGGGVSVGPYEDPDCFIGCTEEAIVREWDPAYWGNAELSFDLRDTEGIQTRFFLGRAFGLNDPHTCLGNAERCEDPGRASLLYIGFAIGFAFGF